MRVPWDYMLLAHYKAEMASYLAQAAELLGAAVRPVEWDWDALTLVRKRLRVEERRGFGDVPAMLSVTDSTSGHSLEYGLAKYRLDTGRGLLRLVYVATPPCNDVGDFWCVPVSEFRAWYRFVRGEVRKSWNAPPPVMHADQQQRLWNNTVGFLRRGSELHERFGVRVKRGVLLTGAPGNGKTMACRWLRGQCQRRGLSWTTITPQQFIDACDDKTLAALFQPQRRGVVFFDDFDLVLMQAGAAGHDQSQTALLAALDGVNSAADVVHVFATNLRPDEIDPALRRPGRIDAIFHFGPPDEVLLRRLVESRWQPEIVASVDVNQIVADASGLSFAELEEARKLLVLRYLDVGRWDWPAALAELNRRRQTLDDRNPIGFHVHQRPVSSTDPSRESPPAITLRG